MLYSRFNENRYDQPRSSKTNMANLEQARVNGINISMILCFSHDSFNSQVLSNILANYKTQYNDMDVTSVYYHWDIEILFETDI